MQIPLKTVTPLVLAALMAAGTTYILVTNRSAEREQKLISELRLQISEQKTTLSTIAEITDRDGADEIVESIIASCPLSTQDRFDSLLNRLGSLNQADLQETESLFNACGRVFAQRKAMMVARLGREVEVYENLIALLAVTTGEEQTQSYDLTQWKNLVALEKKRSSIFSQQADIQADIIDALQAGESVSSENITTKVSEAKNVSEEATVVNKQIDSLRTELHDI